MPSDWVGQWLRWLGGKPSFQIFGKARREKAWRIIDVYATSRRNWQSPWPLWRGTCITWTADLLSVGWDFACQVIAEQVDAPASRLEPFMVAGGRVRDRGRRSAAGTPHPATASEVLAHECGHTWQARRLGPPYLILVGAVTFFGEGPHPWNHFENEASEQGQFGGLVDGSICPALSHLLGIH